MVLQDIDAAYMLGGPSGELEAGLSALLEVPDFDSNSPSCDDMLAGKARSSMQPV